MGNGRKCKGRVWLSERWGKNDEIKAAIRRKEAAWKEMLAASDEEAKIRCMEPYKKKKESK